MDSSSSSSRKSGYPKQSWSTSRKPRFFNQDKGLVSLADPKPTYSPYITSPLAARNASSSASNTQSTYPTYFPPLADNASSSIWNPQPSHLTSNGLLPPLSDYNASSSARKRSTHAYLSCNALPPLPYEAGCSSRKQQATYFNLIPCNEMSSLTVADNASSSASPKKPSGLFNFLNKSLFYAKFSSKSQKKSLLEFRSSNPCFDPDSRIDLNGPILPDSCVRCNQRFNLGKDAGIYMYKDEAYCSLDCRQEQMDIDNPPTKKKENPTPQEMKTATTKKRKTPSATRA